MIITNNTTIGDDKREKRMQKHISSKRNTAKGSNQVSA